MNQTQRRIFQVKPDFFSFVSIGFVIGLCGGVVYGIFTTLHIATDLTIENRFVWSLAALIFGPLANALTFAISAAIGYPIFKLWRRNRTGIRIEGDFVEIDEYNQKIKT